MHRKITYSFSGATWQHASPGGWHFVSLPEDLAQEIRDALKSEEEGWGRLKVIAKIGRSEWKTAIWFDTKMKTYLLPLKAEIRKKEKISIGESINVEVLI